MLPAEWVPHQQADQISRLVGIGKQVELLVEASRL
ncbi:hypothetical protein X731_03025 [Mesorhizobium sp. L2C054A000]|nr:hypothetical protein X731_03025 [Mesorhizobium sp. L2C054A000]